MKRTYLAPFLPNYLPKNRLVGSILQSGVLHPEAERRPERGGEAVRGRDAPGVRRRTQHAGRGF